MLKCTECGDCERLSYFMRNGRHCASYSICKVAEENEKVKSTPNMLAELCLEACRENAKRRHLAQFRVNQSDRHDLPFPRLKSRLASSIVLGYHGCRSTVVSLSIRLSKSSRAYILTQECLPGFVLPKHETLTSCLYELKMSG